MREQLIQYVNLLFAGAPDSEDIKQEILQNTLDRYDDLVSQGKQPEAAYRLAISGIGDVNEILGAPVRHIVAQPPVAINEETPEDVKRKKLRAAAIALYIVCALPLIILGEIADGIIGLALTILLAAAATYLIIISGKPDPDDEADETIEKPEHPVKKRIADFIGTAALVIFLALSFITGAWFITWLIFPIAGCIRGLANAVIDLKEARSHET